jgi:hypothetical protein
MRTHNRREFLADVGRGMLIGSVGAALASDMGLARAAAAEQAASLSFGELEPLVVLMQQTPADKLVPALVEKLQAGTDLKTLVAAGALANARTFGGEDYVGYHSFMALAPANEMSRQLSAEADPLPVLKVLHRNTKRMQEHGGRKSEGLKAITPAKEPGSGERPLRSAVRETDVERAERIFARQMLDSPGEAYNHLQYTVQDAVNVHRVVLAWRAWETLDFVGQENALTLLRQSVRYCVDEERDYKQRGEPKVRRVLPKLIDQYRLLSVSPGTKKVDDAWVDRMARLIFSASDEQAADATAAALAEGVDPEAVGEALSLAACRLVLHDPGRSKERAEPGKPEGSVHGASVGVHGSDAANAWRHIARVSNRRNQVASLVVGAFHTGGQGGRLSDDPYPREGHFDKLRSDEPAKLLAQAEDAIRQRDQETACAAMHRYAELKHDPRPAFQVLLRYGTSEEGALHAEKYYRTVNEEFQNSRDAFRPEQLAALARVTASEFGTTAPGYQQARELLGLG